MRDPHDVVGIGVGPFNLSIASLAHDEASIDSLFLEAEGSFRWHPGMMLPDARLQMSPLKDLVSPVDPTRSHSFLNYLVEHGRFYEWIHADLPAVSRREFEDYLAWVADRLPNVRFDHRVEALTHDGESFEIHVEGVGEPYRSRAIVLGTGQEPSVPACAEGKLGERAFHSASIAYRDLDLETVSVAIVGGGQSGAEVIATVLDGHWGSPERVCWITRRPNFQPLDEIAFTNEYFTPGYVEAFYELDTQRKRELIEQQKLASDGISPSDLRRLYQKIYEMKAMPGEGPEVNLLPGRELVRFAPGRPHRLGCRSLFEDQLETIQADVVVFCTGYRYRIPDLLDPLVDLIPRGDGQPFRLDADFRVHWNGPEGLDIFAVNAGRSSHGIAEPQMSLMAWRGARILNQVAAKPLFDNEQGLSMIDWTRDSLPPTRPQLAAARRGGSPP